MNNIPTKVRAELHGDELYTSGYCIYHDVRHGASTKIEWHHNLIFAGKQVQERWCILPICAWLHEQARNKEVRKKLDWIMLNRADNDTLIGYSKAGNLIQKQNQLNDEYGIPSETQRK